jgi:hypothetical protein
MNKLRGKALPVTLSLFICTFTTARAAAEGLHGKEYWRKIRANHYLVPEGEKAFPLAKELSGYLKVSDPELRDDLAYSILATWISGRDAFSADELLALEAEWRGNLQAGIGESGTDTIFGRSFSALCLSSIAERELKTPFLGEARYRTLLEAALDYLKDERDLRGFDAKKGWIHATAHTADLLAALARHPSFTAQDQARVLKAIAQRIETARVIFAFGEQDRLANVLAAMAGRRDFHAAGFATWVFQMDKADQSIWKDSPPQLDGLQRFENDSYLLSAFVARISEGQMSAAATEARKAALKSLARR